MARSLEQKEDHPVKTTLFLGLSIATLHTKKYSHLPLIFKLYYCVLMETDFQIRTL